MDTPLPPDQLLKKKIQELEAGHESLKDEMSKFMLHGSKLGYYGNQRLIGNEGHDGKMGLSSSHDPSHSRREIGPMSVNFTNKQYLNILQSMGQSIHIFDSNGRVIYWNRMCEQLYGYSASEVLGQNLIDLITEPSDFDGAAEIVHRCSMGENWTGVFPVKNKLGKRFVVTGTCTPLYDDRGSLVGIISVNSASDPFLEVQFPSSGRDPFEAYPTTNCPRSGPTTEPGHDSQQPLQVVIASKISNLASKITNKVWFKIRPGDNTMEREIQNRDEYSDQGFSETFLTDHREGATSSGTSPPKGDIPPSSFGVPSKAASREKSPGKPFGFSDEGEGKTGKYEIITSRAEAWVSKKVKSWSWKQSEQDGWVARTAKGVWPWSNYGQENNFSQKKSSNTNYKPEIQVEENNRFEMEASCSLSSSFNVTSVSRVSIGGSTSSSVIHKVHGETDSFGYDILWEDLTIGEQLGQAGSSGTVFRGLWYGLDVAVKVFSKLEYSDDLLHSFRQEVSFLKRLQHPNVVLFMGAVTSPQQLCIVTEFFPCGSLFQLLQRIPKLYWRRRVLMALDIARGMNYLHQCNPPIVHRDLKSTNLLVDKNLTVKVGDFGLSQLKHQPRIGKGSYIQPQWMAPEVLRGEPSDEKSDVYSYGVILWELATQKIPWGNLNSMQVIKAVGFMNERVEIPKDMDQGWVSIIESCWHSEPRCRPTFAELIVQLNDFLRQYSVQVQATRLTQDDTVTTLAPQV